MPYRIGSMPRLIAFAVVDVDISALPPQPCVLDHVFGSSHLAQHAVGEREHRGSMLLKDVGIRCH